MDFRKHPLRRILALAALAALAATACRPAPAPAPLKVGSKDFTEQFILGEMYALLLEDAGYTVERKFNLGPTPAAHAALEKGEIDLYPEYTGTALVTVLKQPASNDAQQVYQAVAQAYREQFNLAWLDPAPTNNTQALAMTKSEATKLRVLTLSSLAARARELAEQGRPLIMAGPPEFLDREDGLPGLQKVYGEFPVTYLPLAIEDRYRALIGGDAQVVVAFGTDGEINGFDLALLLDDQKLFPVYQAAPVVRQDALDSHPRMRDALNALAPKLNDNVMRNLNFEVTHRKRPAAEVAREFLTLEGLLKK